MLDMHIMVKHILSDKLLYSWVTVAVWGLVSSANVSKWYSKEALPNTIVWLTGSIKEGTMETSLFDY